MPRAVLSGLRSAWKPTPILRPLTYTAAAMADTELPTFVAPLHPVMRTVAYAVPIVLLAGLLFTYLIAPDFYIRVVLEEQNREHQVVEIITFISALLAAPLLWTAAWRTWRSDPGLRLGALGLAVVGLAAFFFAGEEISWGQTWLGWNTPDELREYTVETNLHNMRDLVVSVQTLGSVFLMLVFFAIPLGWRLDRSHRFLPRSLGPMVPDGAAVFTLACAFAIKGFKDVIRVGFEHALETDFYHDFLEQANEQKEMLVAVALLLYGVLRLFASRTWSRS